MFWKPYPALSLHLLFVIAHILYLIPAGEPHHPGGLAEMVFSHLSPADRDELSTLSSRKGLATVCELPGLLPGLLPGRQHRVAVA